MSEQLTDGCTCGHLLSDHDSDGTRPCLWCGCDGFVWDGGELVRREVT